MLFRSNLCFCDGHVRFINNSIDVKAWRSLGSRNGHEAVAGFYPALFTRLIQLV